MTQRTIALLVLLTLSLWPAAGFSQPRKVHVGIPTVDIITLPLKMAQAKGFYQKEGLEVEIILIAGALGPRRWQIPWTSPPLPDRSWRRRLRRRRQAVLIVAAKPTFDLVSEPKVHHSSSSKASSSAFDTRRIVEHLTRLMRSGTDSTPTRT
jgi:hypothetical protein